MCASAWSQVELAEELVRLRRRVRVKLRTGQGAGADHAKRGFDDAFLLGARDCESVGVVVAHGAFVLGAGVSVDVDELEVRAVGLAPLERELDEVIRV